MMFLILDHSKAAHLISGGLYGDPLRFQQLGSTAVLIGQQQFAALHPLSGHGGGGLGLGQHDGLLARVGVNCGRRAQTR